MSDEIHMQVAHSKHRDQAAREPWQGVAPDEALMMAEEMAEEMGAEGLGRAATMEALMVYLFADGVPERWQNVAVRGQAVMRHCAPWLLQKGRKLGELPALQRAAVLHSGYGLEEFMKLCENDGFREVLGGLMSYIFPTGNRWMYKGAQRAYLLALHFQPWLVAREGKELTYEGLARIFEGDGLATRKERSAARSRWSARFQELVRKPIERAGGIPQVHKSAGAREKMAASARGNTNRKKGRGVPSDQ